MTFYLKEKVFSTKWFKNYSLVIVGSFIMASAYVFFITPHNIVPGGVFGIGIVINKLTLGMFTNGLFGYFVELFNQYGNGIPVGITSWLINVPLTILGIIILGPKFGLKTIIGFTFCAIFMDAITKSWGSEPLVDDVLLSCIFGSILIGVGLGLIFKARATTAGSDIIAMIVNKYTSLPLGQLIIYVDACIVMLSLLISDDWKIPLYSFVVVYLTGKVIDMTLEGRNIERAVLIITKEHKIVKDYLVNTLERGGTYLNGEGVYSGEEQKVLFTVITRRELMLLEDKMLEVDPTAFVTVMNTNEILGEGFKSLKDKKE